MSKLESKFIIILHCYYFSEQFLKNNLQIVSMFHFHIVFHVVLDLEHKNTFMIVVEY